MKYKVLQQISVIPMNYASKFLINMGYKIFLL